MSRRKSTEPTAADLKKRYEAHKKRVREQQAEIAKAGREIGTKSEGGGQQTELTLPPVENPERRERCRLHLLTFCRTYHPAIFTKPVSKNHPRICEIMEQAVLNGGKYAWCDHRGGGKTTFSECFIEWALLYGHAHFVVYCGASAEAAAASFESIKTELETNDLLLADFPEVCVPIRALEGKPQRAGGMLLNGKPLGMEWKADKIVLPAVPGSAAAGSVFKAVGFEGRIRGMKHKTAEGKQFRPDCVIVDDIQKDRTARNPKNVDYQLKILENVIGGLGERGRKFTVLVPGTRLSPVCFMSRLMDRKKYPQYMGRIFQSVETFPQNMDLWREYWKVLIANVNKAQEIDTDDARAWIKGREAATEFYRQHRAEMDEGAEVAWPAMYADDEISGLQSNMNIFLGNEDAFWTEYQNEPRSGLTTSSNLDEEILQTKIRADIPRGIVPAHTRRLVLGCDVQKELIYWLVTAWGEGFSGHIVDYGTIPEQPTRDYFDATRPPLPLSQLRPGASLDALLNGAVQALIDGVLMRDWQTEKGDTMRIDRGLIDANWDLSRDAIFTVINRRFRQYRQNGRFEGYPLLPARGRGTSRTGTFYETRKNMESKTQFSFLQKPKTDEELVGTVWINTNKAKTFAAARLTAPQGAPESVTIYGAPYGWHALLFSHLTAEYATPASIGDLKFEKWEMKPARTENHWWDAFIHCVVCNAMEGSRLTEHDAPTNERRVFKSERILR